MKYKTNILVRFLVWMLIVIHFPDVVAAGNNRNQASIVAAELSAIANQLSIRPQTALDLSKVSGEYCFNVNLETGGHMTHYAIYPENTREDVIDFVNAAPLIEAGVKVDMLARFPGKLGGMTPKTWYFLSAGEFEPHHGIRFPYPLLIKAVNLK
jgi:hypothetical protein